MKDETEAWPLQDFRWLHPEEKRQSRWETRKGQPGAVGWAAIRAEHNMRAGERKETQRAREAEGRERMREALQPTVL